MELKRSFNKVTISPPKLGGVRGGLNEQSPISNENISHRHNLQSQTLLRKSLRNNATAPESILWLRLKGRQIEGLKFRRQYGVGPYVIDFYCPKLRLGIELDGEIHYSHEAETYDRLRTRFLNENKVAILRFKNEIVYQNIEVIVEDIKTFAKEKRAERGCSDLP